MDLAARTAALAEAKGSLPSRSTLSPENTSRSKPSWGRPGVPPDPLHARRPGEARRAGLGVVQLVHRLASSSRRGTNSFATALMLAL